jgi:hypothetical protein
MSDPAGPPVAVGDEGEDPWPRVEFKDLETRGFVLVRSFLTEAELSACREDFAAQKVDGENRNYNLSLAGGGADQALRPRIEAVLARVRRSTDLRVDLPLSASYFATARGVNFDWHQDHESYFTIQNHYDYLNFYIPIVKPRRDKSNLSIVPFDSLEREGPQLFRDTARGGATRFRRVGGRRLVFFDEWGTVRPLEDGLDLDRLGCTPELDPGDLLLLRGDMIHRTQDTDTERVALSFRAARSETPVLRRRLVNGGLGKAWMMANHASTYEAMLRAFDALGRASVGFGELQRTIGALPASGPIGRKRFARLLLGRKLREGVLLSFLWSTGRSWAGLVAVLASGRLRRWGPA